VEYRQATPDELPVLAGFTWQMVAENGPVAQPEEDFAQHFLEWARTVRSTHFPFVAADDGLVGMAWLVFVARTPRPGPVTRFDGDLQTVYVVPEHRNRGIGAALVNTLLRHAWERGLGSVTVSSGRRAVSLYQRIGFNGEPPYLRAFPPSARQEPS
jgi:GNAT superfamily N-acetyltransferase